MARAKKAGSSDGRFSDYRFINIHLVKADVEWLEKADCEAEFPLSRIFGLVQSGYKFSLNEDAKNLSFVASITDVRESSPSSKHILTGRGATPIDAWFALAYRHFVLAEGDWTNIMSEASGDSSRFG